MAHYFIRTIIYLLFFSKTMIKPFVSVLVLFLVVNLHIPFTHIVQANDIHLDDPIINPEEPEKPTLPDMEPPIDIVPGPRVPTHGPNVPPKEVIPYIQLSVRKPAKPLPSTRGIVGSPHAVWRPLVLGSIISLIFGK